MSQLSTQNRVSTQNRAVKFIAVAALGLSLSACAQNSGPKQGLGTVGGAILGGIAGAQFGSGEGRLIATGLGAVLGALAGGEIGRTLDNADRQYMGDTTQRALEYENSGESIAWNNPDSGNYGTVTPQPAYQNGTGRYCREFQQTITVGGKREQAYGTACRQPDGSWKIVS